GGDEEGDAVACEQAVGGDRRPVDDGGCKGEERRGCEQEECDGGADQAVERVGSKDAGKGGGGSGKRQNARNVGPTLDGLAVGAAAQELTRSDQEEREQDARTHARGWGEQARLDGVAHKEHAAQDQRETTDRYGPAGAKTLLQRGARPSKDGFGRDRAFRDCCCGRLFFRCIFYDRSRLAFFAFCCRVAIFLISGPDSRRLQVLQDKLKLFQACFQSPGLQRGDNAHACSDEQEKNNDQKCRNNAKIVEQLSKSPADNAARL